jgi:hypothetical protein
VCGSLCCAASIFKQLPQILVWIPKRAHVRLFSCAYTQTEVLLCFRRAASMQRSNSSACMACVCALSPPSRWLLHCLVYLQAEVVVCDCDFVFLEGWHMSSERTTVEPRRLLS